MGRDMREKPKFVNADSKELVNFIEMQWEMALCSSKRKFSAKEQCAE